MTDPAKAPQTTPGEIAQWPMLKIVYRTDKEAIAKLLPPGIDPGETPNVNLTIYNLPVNEEPEYGVLITVNADYQGQSGEYAIGYGIDQEAAIHISVMMNGQPKFPATTEYYRLGPNVTARCHHQGYTFLNFTATVGEEEQIKGDPERFEWWTKYSRKVGGEEGYDFPPHVVKVHGKYGPGYRLALDGKLTLLDSPWDPIASMLPLREQLSSHLWWPEYRSRSVTIAGELDPKAFWPFVDTIGGSRWPGYLGAPPKNK